MRKYLITGVLALVAGGFLTSCHDTDGVYSSIVEQKLQAYEQVFKEEFGEIDPNQDWGFGETNMSARMRTLTRAEGDEHWGDGNTNHNLWGDPNADGGAWNYDVPPALTEGQKLRVYRYFQTHPNLTYVTPPIDDYFVQQVYKGGYDPLGSLQNPNGYSAEEYPTGNAQNTMGSNHMDWLTVTSNNKHVNDFNYGNYDGGNTTTVLNTGESTNNITAQTTHQDQITLMLDARPDCVGYSVSNGSVHHNNCAALVAAKIIDDWALDPNNFDENRKPIGDNVWYDDPTKNLENQKWNRSFVGLDYEQLAPQQCYVNEVDANYQPIPGTIAYVKVDEIIQPNYFRMTVTENNRRVTKIISKAEYKRKYGEYLLDKNGQKIPYISRNSNEICGTNVDFPSQSSYMPQADCTSAGGGNNDQILDLDLIWGKLEINALPTQNASLQCWIKDIGGRDYVFSDWIVTLTPARKIGNDTPGSFEIPIESGGGTKKGKKITTYYYQLSIAQQGRIMCEDLGVISASDIDFNDVVFDAYIYDAEPWIKEVIVDENNNLIPLENNPSWTKDNNAADKRFAEIYILAAGGTLPISVAGERVKDNFGDQNGKTSLSDAIIVNTCTQEGNEAGGAYSNPWQNFSVAQKIVKEDETCNIKLKDLKVVVQYGNQILVLNSERGLAPHKICVPLDLPNGTDVKWPLERVVIKDAYKDFEKYVKNENQTITFNSDAYSTSGDVGEDSNNEYGVPYYNDELSNNCWTTKETGKIDANKLFTSPVTYTPRNLSLLSEENGKLIKRSETEEEIDIPDTSKGYQNGDPVLIRRRD
jgi:hypothetical protein